MPAVDARFPFLTPWLRVNLLIHQIRATTWDSTRWPEVRAILKNALPAAGADAAAGVVELMDWHWNWWDDEGDEEANHVLGVVLVDRLIENAIRSEASEIQIEPFEDTLRIRYRIDGILYEQEAPPRHMQVEEIGESFALTRERIHEIETKDAVTSRIKIMAEMNIAERRLPQDGRTWATLDGKRVDIRVSTIPTVHGESIVMRLLPQGDQVIE